MNDIYSQTGITKSAVTGITNTSTATIETLGIINGVGDYLIALASQAGIAENSSLYIVLRSTSAYFITPIHEGTASHAPRIDSNGVLKLNTRTTATPIGYLVIRIT